MSKQYINKGWFQRPDRAWSIYEQMTLPITVKMAQSINNFGLSAFPLRWHSHYYSKKLVNKSTYAFTFFLSRELARKFSDVAREHNSVDTFSS